MAVYKAEVEIEWAEVYRKGRGKVEDWTHVITFYVDGKQVDQKCMKTASDAGMMATMYELGFFTTGMYGEVLPSYVFAY